MVNITEKILNTWKAKGIDLSKIEAEKKEVDPKRMLLSDGQLLKFPFKIVDEYDLAFWKSLLKASEKIDCVAGHLKLRSSMNFKLKTSGKDIEKIIYEPDSLPCFLEFTINIDEKYLNAEGMTDKQLEDLTKPEFIQKACIEDKKTTPVPPKMPEPRIIKEGECPEPPESMKKTVKKKTNKKKSNKKEA